MKYYVLALMCILLFGCSAEPASTAVAEEEPSIEEEVVVQEAKEPVATPPQKKSSFTFPRYNSAIDYGHRNKINANKPDVILVGASLSHTNINEATLESELSTLTGKSIDALRISWDGSQSTWWYLVLKNLIATSDVKNIPVLVVYRTYSLMIPEYRTTGKYAPMFPSVVTKSEDDLYAILDQHGATLKKPRSTCEPFEYCVETSFIMHMLKAMENHTFVALEMPQRNAHPPTEQLTQFRKQFDDLLKQNNAHRISLVDLQEDALFQKGDHFNSAGAQKASKEIAQQLYAAGVIS